MRFAEHVRARLADIEHAGLLRTPRRVTSPQGPTAVVDGREVVLLCSNDYLGHAAHPDLAAAQRDALARWGSGAAASRLISGTMSPHREAELALARFAGQESSLLFSSGYAANVGAISALVGPGDLVLSDTLNHASLIDGCRLSRARVLVYRHADVEHAAELLTAHRHEARTALLVTDSIFSMDGDLAPLAALRDLADRFDAGLYVDEAHALGVRGPGGRGLCAELDLDPDVILGTLGKSLGLGGAFVTASSDVIRLVENRARSFVFSTGTPPALAAAVPTALHLLERADEGRARLAAHTARLRRELPALGFDVPAGETPIIPVLLGEPAAAMRVSAALLERGVFAHGIRPPTVPQGTSRLRLVPTAAHTDEHLDRVLHAFAAVAADRRR
ncbi:8-amino-7-oxononanoate synthase [Sandaracinus amylolyticus]|uniref:8-amino-7-oxononanoate synthase n=1 Tax=Sandaracinus amylolyticus TaxID=927083 RepID=UPI003AF336C1|nr:Hypothetical protein I5071_71380 [Sandaracinus amylolyticus]